MPHRTTMTNTQPNSSTISKANDSARTDSKANAYTMTKTQSMGNANSTAISYYHMRVLSVSLVLIPPLWLMLRLTRARGKTASKATSSTTANHSASTTTSAGTTNIIRIRVALRLAARRMRWVRLRLMPMPGRRIIWAQLLIAGQKPVLGPESMISVGMAPMRVQVLSTRNKNANNTTRVRTTASARTGRDTKLKTATRAV